MSDDTPRRGASQPVDVLAIVQARAGSSRLPGKIGSTIGDRSLLAWVVARLREARRIDRIVVATTVESSDDATVAEATALGVERFRGPVDDVLARFVGAVEAYPAATICRITADNPLLDPATLDRMIERHLADDSDYTGAIGPTPLGSTAEVVATTALLAAHNETDDRHCREHVTPYLYTHPEQFRLILVPPADYLAGRRERLTVDTGEDMRLMRTLHARLTARGEPFAIKQVMRLMAEDPSLGVINAGVRQKEWSDD